MLNLIQPEKTGTAGLGFTEYNTLLAFRDVTLD